MPEVAEMPASWLRPDSVMLNDKIGVVTGAGTGIGKGVALGIARFGGHVAICDRNEGWLRETEAEIVAETGARVLAHHLDVRQPERVKAWFEDIRDEFGRVDILVNNVGGVFAATFLQTSPKGEATLIAENFTSATDVIRNAMPLIPDGASIINITSIEASRACPGLSIYGAMKAALENLTMSLALELGDRGIRVNSIAPDSIISPGGQGVATTPPTEFTLPGLGKDSFVPMTPLRFLGDPDDIAAAVVFLASPMGRFVTGSVLRVDGGNHGAGGWFRRRDVLPPVEAGA